MRIHYLLFAFFFVFLLLVPGESTVLRCIKRGGKCLAFRCKKNMKAIDSCGIGVICCKRK